MKILIVEDEQSLQQSIVTYLSKEGNICEVASDFDEGKYKLDLYEYDITVLDINLITGSGLDLLKNLKTNNKETGVIIISANNSLEDKLEGLDFGADDYLTKPFHLSELNARIKAVYRRKKLRGNSLIEYDDISINTDSKEVLVAGEKLSLTAKEYALILFFISNKNRILSKEAIAEHLWGDYIDLADNYDFIYVHINNLRRKLKMISGNNYINTVYGMGYKIA